MKKKYAGYVTGILLAAALGMCIYGAANKETDVIFTKAVNICMECIGLG